MPSYKEVRDKVFQNYLQQGTTADVNQANVYRAALEKSAYGDFANQYGAGLNDITNYLARSGPLADSGAATNLRTKLAGQLYGQAQGRIQGGYADYLRQLQTMRLQNQYQRELLKYQKKLQGGGNPLGSIVGGALGAVTGGPVGAVTGAASGWGNTPWGS